MIRLFAAFDAPPHIAAGLTDCRQGVSGAAWRPPEALHVTLRFFGEIDEGRADDLDAELTAIRASAFAIHLEGVGVFGEGERRTALWAGAAPLEPLTRLAAKCETAARKAGLKPDTRTYRPHMTLAYLREPAGFKVAAWIAQHNLMRSPAWTPQRFGLYSSQLGRSGSRYTLEREYHLR